VVVSHRPPPPSVASYPSVTYVTDGATHIRYRVRR
jgi:hypothetical protein